MAKKKNMTMEEALQVILASEGDNPFRDMIRFIVQNALEFEMTEHLRELAGVVWTSFPDS